MINVIIPAKQGAFHATLFLGLVRMQLGGLSAAVLLAQRYFVTHSYSRYLLNHLAEIGLRRALMQSAGLHQAGQF